MAVTVTATKIDVTTGSETLKTIYTAVAASGFPGVMTEDTADQEYTINGNVELEISSGATLDITNATYNSGHLHWDGITTNGTKFDCVAGSTVNITASSFEIDLDEDDTKYNYWQILGDFTIQGTSGNEIVIKHCYRLRLYVYGAGQTGVIDYVKFENPSSYGTTGSNIYIEAAREKPAWTFSNITMIGHGNSNYALSISGGLDVTGCTFDNFTIEDTRFGINTYSSPLKVTNSKFENIYYYNYLRGGNTGLSYKSQYDTTFNSTQMNQPKITFEDCTFEDNYDSGKYGLYLVYGATVKVKNCTFVGVDAALVYGINGYFQGRILLQGGIAGQTWTNVTNNLYFSAANNMGYYEVYELDLTVQDADAVAIADATVTVRQKEGHECHHFKTDASGNIKDCHGDNPVFVYREILNNTPTYDTWSDGTGDQVHIIEIAKTGYTLDTREVNFDSNQTISATLTANPTATTIYDSTLYDSTIY